MTKYIDSLIGKDKAKEFDKNSVRASISEILFIVLPLLILAIVYLYNGKGSLIFSASEWSMISSIVYGQIIVKIVSVTSKGDVAPDWAVFIVTIFLVIGLFPSIIVLIITLLDQGKTVWIPIVQIINFTISIFSYFIFCSSLEFADKVRDYVLKKQ